MRARGGAGDGMEFTIERGRVLFWSRCSCGWTTDRYPQAGMVAAALSTHTSDASCGVGHSSQPGS
jgi:hypothetical protein